ncbi:MAG: hypothetical protein RB191_24350 [Terriglobia bacterium]|nr:hypothetical protein [Terriglobia bacterium]
MKRTPNDHLRMLLLDLAEKHGLSDSDIARAHIRAHPESTLTASTVQRFRTGTPAPGTPPSFLMEEAYAEATHTTRQQNWNEAIRRWRLALKNE